jgi:hypothetical protein
MDEKPAHLPELVDASANVYRTLLKHWLYVN